ncbi:mCG144622, partial [Mus musculus]
QASMAMPHHASWVMFRNHSPALKQRQGQKESSPVTHTNSEDINWKEYHHLPITSQVGNHRLSNQQKIATSHYEMAS